MPASDRVWLTSYLYHLVGATQTWYYALEQDEGMPSWEHFKDLCSLRFDPTIRYNRLPKLHGYHSTTHSRITRSASMRCCATIPWRPKRPICSWGPSGAHSCQHRALRALGPAHGHASGLRVPRHGYHADAEAVGQ